MARDFAGVDFFAVVLLAADFLVGAFFAVESFDGASEPAAALSSSCSSGSATSAVALTLSPDLRFITLTPWVARPVWEISPAEVRWTIPFCEMKRSS